MTESRFWRAAAEVADEYKMHYLCNALSIHIEASWHNRARQRLELFRPSDKLCACAAWWTCSAPSKWSTHKDDNDARVLAALLLSEMAKDRRKT